MGRNQPHPPKLSGQHPSRRRRESSSSAGPSPGTDDGSDEDDRSLSSSQQSKKKASAASRARSASTTRAHQTNSETIRGGRTRKPNPRSTSKSSKMPSPQNSKHQITESEEDEDFDDENSSSQTERTKPAAGATRKRPNVRITRSSSSKQSKSSAPDDDDDDHASTSKRQRRQQPSRAAARDSKINYMEPEMDDEDDQVDESEDEDDKSVVIMDSVEVFDGDQPIDSNESRAQDSISGESKSKSSTNRSPLNYTPYQPPPSTHAQPQERVDPSCPEFLERHHRALRRVHFEQEERDDDASSVASRSSQRSCNSQKRRRRRSKKNQSAEDDDDEASVSSRASTSSTSNRTASRQNQATTGKRSALKAAPTYDHRLFAKEGQLPQKKATSNSVSSSPAWQQKPAAKSTTSQQSRAAPPASTAAPIETGNKKTRGRPRKQAPVSVPVVGQDDDDGSAQTTQAGNGSSSSIDQTTRRGGTQSARAGQPLTPGLETTSSEIPRNGRGPSRNHPASGSAGASSTPMATTTHGPAPLFDGAPPTAFPAQNGTSVNNRTPRVELSTHIRNLRWPSTAKTSLEWLKATIDDRVLADDEGGGVISDELKEYLTEAKMMGLYMELIYCIAAFPTREDVQRLGIFTLDALLMVREGRELLITLDHGIIGLIVKAMQSHSGHIELINRGVHCLMTIFSAPGDVMSLDEATLTELKDASLSKFMSDSSAISTILNSTNDQHIFKDVYTQTYLMNLITSLISLDIDLGEKYKVRQGFEAAGATMKLSKVLEYFRNKDRELYKKAKKIINSLTAMEEEMED